jgi:23S rRNA (guanine745-N1)-methyltransferase
MGDLPPDEVPAAVDTAAAAFARGEPTPFACPHDHTELRIDGPRLICAAGHSFDRAREGHANLILPGQRSSRDPGDSPQMVAARRTFLGSGAYAPLADAAAASVPGLWSGTERTTDRSRLIVESGCGEGYYLDHLARRAAADGWAHRVTLAGIDISRHAVKAAAKRPATAGVPIGWAVANARYLPFQPASVDLILCLFGFPVWEGFRAVQGAGASVLLADPGPDHLIELRELIYPTVRRSQPPSLGDAIAHGYQFADQTHVRFQTELISQVQIQSLVAMTPHAFRLTRDGHAALLAIDRLTATVDVVLRRLVLAA